MNRPDRGKIIVLVAPSGAGKSTMAKRLIDDFGKIRFSVSATTRPPRSGEKDGVDYHFLTTREFEQKIEAGDFLEWEEFYNGKRYGTLRTDVENHLEKGYFILLDIEVYGAENVKKIYEDDALCIFIRPPSIDELKRRLELRGTDSEEMIRVRLERAGEELGFADRFDHIVVNDDLERAYAELKQLVKDFTKTSGSA